MLRFENDYQEGAHELIWQRFIETNREATEGYGFDPYTAAAKEKIKIACACPEADVFLVSGGTQANQLVISSMLLPFEGVLCADTGHINGHEAGAIEYSGHRILPLPGTNGKLSADSVAAYMESFFENTSHDHMVAPGMVYISHPTEYGTLYTKDELLKLSAVCRNYHLSLFVDGARLGYALATKENDISLPDMAELADVFYIGGTKCGALCGEAIVFTKKNMPSHFFTQIKQHGALLAKGRTVGIQFDTLFTDNLYVTICRNAIEKANRLRNAFREKGYVFHLETVTNQIFVVLTNEQYARLSENVVFSFWERKDKDHIVARFVTSWATENEATEQLISLL